MKAIWKWVELPPGADVPAPPSDRRSPPLWENPLQPPHLPPSRSSSPLHQLPSQKRSHQLPDRTASFAGSDRRNNPRQTRPRNSEIPVTSSGGDTSSGARALYSMTDARICLLKCVKMELCTGGSHRHGPWHAICQKPGDRGTAATWITCDCADRASTLNHQANGGEDGAATQFCMHHRKASLYEPMNAIANEGRVTSGNRNPNPRSPR